MRHDIARLTACVREAMRDLEVFSLRELAEGFHSSVYLLNDEWILRVANTDEAAIAYRREEFFLPVIKSCLTAHVPEPVTYKAEDVIFAVHPLIEGGTYTEMCEKGSGPTERISNDIACFLTQLHQCNGLKYHSDIRHFSFVDSMQPDAIFDAAQYLKNYSTVKKEYEMFLLLAETCEKKEKVLVHGDLNYANIIVKADHSGLAGIIDFSELSYQIPEHDFSPLIKSDPETTIRIAEMYTGLTSCEININYVALCAKMRAYNGLANSIDAQDDKKIRHFLKRLRVLEYFSF